MKPKLMSVIVPAFNAEKFIASALESIFTQDYPHHEVIVVDDGSTDGTAAIAQSYPGVHYFYQPNQGPAVARNKGLAHSTGELISFLDADDIWLPGRSSREVQYLESHPEFDCIIAGIRNFLEPGVSQPSWVSDEMLEKDSSVYQLGTLLAHRWVFEKVGEFDQSYFPSTDTEWFIRLVEAGIRMGIMSEVVLKRRIHAANVSYNTGAAAKMPRILKASIDRKRAKQLPVLAG